MAYEAGNLQVTINGISSGASKSINTVINRLGALQTALNTLNVTNLNALNTSLTSFGAALGAISVDSLKNLRQAVSALKNFNVAITRLTSIDATASSKIVAFFTDLGNGIKQIDGNALASIANLGASIKSLSSITGLTKLEKLDWDKIASGFSNLTTAITPFIDKVKEAETSLNALYGILQKTSGKKIQNLLDPTSKKDKKSSTDKLFNLAKITAFYRIAKRVGSAVANIVQYGVDYTETLNLWTVAMRDNLTQADEFIKKMNRAYGISEKTLMNSQAIFKNMLGSLGQISGDTAYALSEALVQMSADFASLYNVSFQSALTKMQAMLAGQVRPIRIAGLDITETTLFQFYQELGGTKTMRQLTRTEKQLLSILAVFKQMGRAGALGDMQKTIMEFANQSRMINENFTTMLTWAGVIGKTWIENTKILVYTNALLITMGEVLKAVAMSMNAIDGSKFLETEYENTQNTNKALDELQGKLLDFDKFRALNSAEDNQAGLIDQSIIDAITGYKDTIKESENEARMLADRWLKILGFTIDAEGRLGNVDTALANIKEKITDIGGAVGAVFATIAAFKIVGFLSGIAKSVTALKAVLSFKNLGIAAIIAGLSYLYITNEEFRKSINNLVTTLGTALKPVLQAIGNVLTSLAPVLTQIVNFIAPILAGIVNIVAKTVEWLDKNDLLDEALGALIAIKISSWLGGFAKGLTDIVPKLLGTKSAVSKLNIAMGAVAGVLGYMVGDMILSNLGEDARKIVAPIMLAVGALTALAAAILAVNGVISWGVGIPAILGAVGVGVAGLKSMLTVENYAVGASDIDSGTIFRAGEAGKTEAVFNGSNGKANVANVSQMEQAYYNALVRYGRENRGTNTPIQVNINGKPVFNAVRTEANKVGLDFSKR